MCVCVCNFHKTSKLAQCRPPPTRSMPPTLRGPIKQTRAPRAESVKKHCVDAPYSSSLWTVTLQLHSAHWTLCQLGHRKFQSKDSSAWLRISLVPLPGPTVLLNFKPPTEVQMRGAVSGFLHHPSHPASPSARHRPFLRPGAWAQGAVLRGPCCHGKGACQVGLSSSTWGLPDPLV